MATTQYIGARYVPLIYTASDNSNNWEANVQYEPLTIVTYLNQSYTSKKQVPASVGNPADNPTYWILSGAYNAQLANLQTDVDNLQNDVDDLKREVNKILFIGDSFNTIYANEGWDVEMISRLGLDPDDYFQINIAGLGFASSPSWTNALLNRLSIIDDKDLYKAIIVCGGANDRGHTQAEMITAFESFKTVTDANFPNAQVYVGFLGWSGLTTQHTDFRTACEQYIAASNYVGFAYLHNVEYVLHWIPYLRDNTGINPQDYIHPTSAGLVALGGKIFDAYLTGTCTVKYSAAMTLTPDGTNCSQIAGDPCTVLMENNVTTIILGAQTLGFPAAIANLTGKNIGTFTCDCFNPTSVANPIFARNVTTGATVPINTVFNAGKISIAAYVDIAANNHRTMPVVYTIPSMSA